MLARYRPGNHLPGDKSAGDAWSADDDDDDDDQGPGRTVCRAEQKTIRRTAIMATSGRTRVAVGRRNRFYDRRYYRDARRAVVYDNNSNDNTAGEEKV